jgi:hypothetical protein
LPRDPAVIEEMPFVQLAPGGIATFPSFHATIAILTPPSLRSFRLIFIALLFLNAAMLAATVTEGAHYLIDIIAGSGMAFFGYAMAKRIPSKIVIRLWVAISPAECVQPDERRNNRGHWRGSRCVQYVVPTKLFAARSYEAGKSSVKRMETGANPSKMRV